jgi:nicotinamide mononucleotide adenylyltransferase|tara:strand:+ start:2285 stop:3529 length:1245 start_codon:yes stop_codon:yes gene_type:complete
MKSFFQFLSESESQAATQARKLGLKGDGHGGWLNRAGEFVAKTEDGKLKFFNKNQKPGKDPDQTPNSKKVQPILKTKTMSVDKTSQKEKGGEEKVDDKETATSETLTLAFGRFNPPTVGHEKLLKMASKTAAGGDLKIYPSRTQDAKKNPLDPDMKVSYMRKMFPDFEKNIVNDEEMRSIFNVLQNADGEYKNVTIIVGSDRQAEFENLATKYNGELYNFDEIRVVSAGVRDADAEGVEGMSASKMRKAVADDDFESFKRGVPASVKDADAQALFDAVRTGMGVKKQKVTAEMWEIAPRYDARGLREQFVNGLIYNIGDIVESLNTGLIGKIIRRGTNHLICVTEQDHMFKSWIRDVMEYTEKKMERRYRVPGKPNTLEGTGGYRKNAMAAMGVKKIKNFNVEDFINKYKVKKS